jgi:hypothetical protein
MWFSKEHFGPLSESPNIIGHAEWHSNGGKRARSGGVHEGLSYSLALFEVVLRRIRKYGMQHGTSAQVWEV